MNATVLGIAATVGQCHDRIARRPAAHRVAGGNHAAGDLQARQRTCILRYRVFPLSLEHIGAVDARRLDFHEHLMLAGLRQFCRDALQYLGPAWLPDGYGTHDVG